MTYEEYEEQRKTLIRRWSLNCAVALLKDEKIVRLEEMDRLKAKAEDVIKVAKIFESYLSKG